MGKKIKKSEKKKELAQTQKEPEKALQKIKPPEIESTPMKAWKDENGQMKLAIDPAISDPVKTYNQLVGVKDSQLAQHIVRTGVHAIKSFDPNKEHINIILQSLHDMKPKDSVEASLITQAITLHSQGMTYLWRADQAELFEQMQHYGNLATKFLRLHNETIEALSRYRRGGEQRVVIQHQQVNLSGQAQAVVGQFHAQGEGVMHKNQGDNPCRQYAEPKLEQTVINHAVSPQWQMGDAASTEENARVQKPKKDDVG